MHCKPHISHITTLWWHHGRKSVSSRLPSSERWHMLCPASVKRKQENVSSLNQYSLATLWVCWCCSQAGVLQADGELYKMSAKNVSPELFILPRAYPAPVPDHRGIPMATLSLNTPLIKLLSTLWGFWRLQFCDAAVGLFKMDVYLYEFRTTMEGLNQIPHVIIQHLDWRWNTLRIWTSFQQTKEKHSLKRPLNTGCMKNKWHENLKWLNANCLD